MITKRLVITAGEPAGIGPDLTLALSQESWPHQLVVCADKNLLAQRAKMLGIDVELLDYDPASPKLPQQSGTLVVKHIPLAEPT
ncbi:4-hydroxythreonine-4-phosphate dehydrogenase PdxA, partial [Vibrio sp. 10N.222.55.E8]